MRKTVLILLSIVLALAIAFPAIGCDGERSAGEVLEESLQTETYKELIEEAPVETIDAGDINSAIVEASRIISPSVVNIRVTVRGRDVFGRRAEAEGVGSGVIYTEDGYILTNYHVVGEADSILVTLYDGEEYAADLIGAHEDTDIAVIKIDSESLAPAGFSSIDDISVGEIVIAVGSPFGFSQTVTMGVVSAKERDISVSSSSLPLVDLIQTDAAINQGNSGGPLVDISGKVIGINSLIFSTSGTSAGIGFAIPSDTAVNISDQIIEYGEPRVPYIGFYIGENTTDITGVYVEDVEEGYGSGLMAGDIIVEINGREVKTAYDVLARILRHDVGDKLDVRAYRDGGYIGLEVDLVESPGSP